MAWLIPAPLLIILKMNAQELINEIEYTPEDWMDKLARGQLE